MGALLSSQIGDTDSVVKYINEARELGIEILPPDVNESGYKFTVVADKKVRFGLGAIRNVGKAAIDSILGARTTAPFTSLFEFCERVDLRLCNKRVFEALIASGALDSLGAHRAQLWAAVDGAIQEASLKQQDAAIGQVSLFGDVAADGESAGPAHPRTLPNTAPMSDSERLAKEKEILGFYISGHPLEPYRIDCEIFATHKVAQLGAWTEQPVRLGVVITAIRRQLSKRTGAEFARLTVEDFSGSAEVLVFPEAWSVVADRVRTDVPVLITGAYSRRDQGAENPTLIVEGVEPLAGKRVNGDLGVEIELGPGAGVKPDVLPDVRAVLETHATAASAPPLTVRWSDGGHETRLRSRSYRLKATDALLKDLRDLLGDARVRPVRGS
jgi:DNA polymerase-3 subunit alpha